MPEPRGFDHLRALIWEIKKAQDASVMTMCRNLTARVNQWREIVSTKFRPGSEATPKNVGPSLIRLAHFFGVVKKIAWD